MWTCAWPASEAATAQLRLLLDCLSPGCMLSKHVDEKLWHAMFGRTARRSPVIRH